MEGKRARSRLGRRIGRRSHPPGGRKQNRCQPAASAARSDQNAGPPRNPIERQVPKVEGSLGEDGLNDLVAEADGNDAQERYGPAAAGGTPSQEPQWRIEDQVQGLLGQREAQPPANRPEQGQSGRDPQDGRLALKAAAESHHHCRDRGDPQQADGPAQEPSGAKCITQFGKRPQTSIEKDGGEDEPRLGLAGAQADQTSSRAAST